MAPDVNNLSLVDAQDPHGNGQPTKEIVYTDPTSGEVIHPGWFVSQHGGNKLRFVQANAGPSADVGNFFEVFATSTSVTVSAGRTVINEV